MMVECGICFSEYREDELELHREMCVILLMFRCILCHVDFVSKEGLWNHLDQHEIADESKELHYQEMKAKYKLHQCVLCNDQRAYSEILYWNHVHNVHDGFFLLCSHCGEKFQSERHRNDHVLSECKARDQTVASNCGDLEVDQASIKVEKTSDHKGEASRNKQQDDSLNMNHSPVENLNNKDKRKSNRSRSAIDYADPDPDMIEKKAAVKSSPRPKKRVANVSTADPVETKCFDCDKDYATAYLLRQHIRTCHKPIECTVCGITCYGADRARSHKISKHTDPSFECAKCLKKFHLKKHYTRHTYSCGLSSSEKNHLPEVEDLIKEAKSRRSLLSRETPPVSQTDGPGGNSDPILPDRTDFKIKQEKTSREEMPSAECSQCGIRESSAATLIRHILIHHEPVACDICGTTSSNFVQAQIHKGKVHKELKNKCPYCSIQVWGGIQFQRHVLKCKDLKFPCKLCGKTFASTSAVTEHTNICRPKPVCNDRINFNVARRNVHDGTDSSTVIEKDVLPQNGLSDTKCYYCNEDYSSPGLLTHHLQTYHELMKCDICGIMILGISSRKLHKVFNHTEAKFPCPNCGKKFYQKGAYDKHRPNCERKKFSCEICGHRSKHLNIIRRHKRLEHPDCVTLEETVLSTQEDRPKENLCTKVEDNANNLDEVRPSKHNSTLDRRNSNNDEEVKPLEDSRSSEHVLVSGKEDEDGDSLVVESESRVLSGATLNDGCEIKSEKISPPPVENASVQKYRCSVCDETYSEFSDIREHMLSSHMDGLFQCQSCSKKCRTMKEMEEHAIICADRKYSCEFCGKKFKYRQGAKKHQNLFHPGTESTSNEIIKDTACTGEQTSIKVEEIDCENSSEENSSLQQQDEESSSETDQPKCSYCAKSFSSEDLLSRHVEKCHEPSACDICGLTFVAVGKARNHKINMHSKREKFECPYCPMKYLVYERYEQHLPICKSKEFPCDVCGIKFQEQRYVERHKKKVHEDQGTSKRARRKTKTKAEKFSDEKEVPLLHAENSSTGSSEKKVQTSNASNTRPHSGPIEIKMEINVEDTNLQEQPYQGLNVDQAISCASTAGCSGDRLQTNKHPYDRKSKDAEAENTSVASAIKIKQEYQEEEDEGNSIGTTTTESSEYNGVTSSRNESLVGFAGGARASPYYMTQIHTELLYNNPESELLFSNSNALHYRSNMPSKAAKKKLRLEEHSSDSFDTSGFKRIKIEKPD